MSYFQIVLLIVIFSLCASMIINRICTCIEHCVNAKYFTKYSETIAKEGGDEHE